MKEVIVLFPEGDQFADAVLGQFLTNSSSRRPRQFELTPAQDSWSGQILYGQEKQLSIPVRVIRQATTERPDWCVSAATRLSVKRGKGHFTTKPSLVSNIGPNHRAARHLIGLRLIPGWTAANVANHLGAVITRHSINASGFLSFPGGEQGVHQGYFERWFKAEVPLQLISACCLHASEDRRGIAPSLDPGLINLLVRVAQASFANLPSVASWQITTFGPDDYEWLGELGIMKVLLPYMWDAARERVAADLAHNFALTQQLVARLNEALPFPVTCHQLHEGATTVDMEFLVRAAEQRAEQMMPKLLDSPPAIFAQLKSDEEKKARIQQEAFLYLYDTIRWGQKPGLQDQPATMYVGLEVHGGYWQHGDLFRGPNDEFLPLVWLPQAVRQHWAPWTRKNDSLNRERLRIEQTLRHYGH